MKKFLLICLLVLPISVANLICYYSNGRMLYPLTSLAISFMSLTVFIRNYDK